MLVLGLVQKSKEIDRTRWRHRDSPPPRSICLRLPVWLWLSTTTTDSVTIPWNLTRIWIWILFSFLFAKVTCAFCKFPENSHSTGDHLDLINCEINKIVSEFYSGRVFFSSIPLIVSQRECSRNYWNILKRGFNRNESTSISFERGKLLYTIYMWKLERIINVSIILPPVSINWKFVQIPPSSHLK